MRLRATQNVLAGLLTLAVGVWCAASYGPIANGILRTFPSGSSPGGLWFLPIVWVDAIAAALAFAAFVWVSPKLPEA